MADWPTVQRTGPQSDLARIRHSQRSPAVGKGRGANSCTGGRDPSAKDLLAEWWAAIHQAARRDVDAALARSAPTWAWFDRQPIWAKAGSSSSGAGRNRPPVKPNWATSGAPAPFFYKKFPSANRAEVYCCPRTRYARFRSAPGDSHGTTSRMVDRALDRIGLSESRSQDHLAVADYAKPRPEGRGFCVLRYQ